MIRTAWQDKANCVLSSLETLETVVMIDMWHSILSRFNATSEKLQSTNCELKVALNMLCSLVKFLEDMRSRFNEVEARCIAQSGISEYHSLMVRCRKRNTRYDDDTDCYVQEGVTLTGRESFKVETYLIIITSWCRAWMHVSQRKMKSKGSSGSDRIQDTSITGTWCSFYGENISWQLSIWFR